MPVSVAQTRSASSRTRSASSRVRAWLYAPEFAEVLQAFPNLPIVVEHLGSGNLPDGSESTANPRQQIFDLARFPNAHLKIHGLGEFAKRAMPVRDPFPFEQPIPPLLDLAVQAFGPNRVMWGSDGQQPRRLRQCPQLHDGSARQPTRSRPRRDLRRHRPAGLPDPRLTSRPERVAVHLRTASRMSSW